MPGPFLSTLLFAVGAAVMVVVFWAGVVAPIAALIKPQPVVRTSLGRHRAEDGALGSTRALGHAVLHFYGVLLGGAALAGLVVIAALGIRTFFQTLGLW